MVVLAFIHVHYLFHVFLVEIHLASLYYSALFSYHIYIYICSSQSGSDKPKSPNDCYKWLQLVTLLTGGPSGVIYVGLSPLPVTVTTRIITFLVGDPYKPSFATVTGRGNNPKYM